MPNFPSNSKGSTRVLFICLGNICRSPLAQGIFQHQVQQQGRELAYHVESAGLGDWHIGHAPDPRSQTIANENGIILSSFARQVKTPQDFQSFDWILAMDRQNRMDLLSLAPAKHRHKIRLIREFDPECTQHDQPDPEVPDPYYGGLEGFQKIFTQLNRSCQNLFDFLEQEKQFV